MEQLEINNIKSLKISRSFYRHISIQIYARPPQKNLRFHILMREIGQQKHVRAILRVENIPVMVRHRQELYLPRDG